MKESQNRFTIDNDDLLFITVYAYALLFVTAGNKSRGDRSTMLDANHKLVKEAVARKKEEYRNNVEVIQISKMYELQKVLKYQRIFV